MRYVCLLRGINVSGHRKLPMEELLAITTELGCNDAISYLQSGNIVLSTGMDRATLQHRLESEICARFGYADVDVMAWTAAELGEAIGALPPAWKPYDTATLHFTFLKNAAPLGAGRGQHLDEYVVGTKVVYVYCPNGYGRTKLNNSFFEKLLDTRATTRNWNTTNKLLELALA